MFRFYGAALIGLSWPYLSAFAMVLAGGVVLAALFPVFRRCAGMRLNKTGKSRQTTDRPVFTGPRTERKQDECLTENGVSLLFVKEMAGLITSFTNENMAGLFRSRMEDLEDESTDSAKAAAMVSMLDEIRIMEPGIQGADSENLHRVAEAIHQELRRMGAEVVDKDAWDPQWQRAVEVRRDLPRGATPVIAEKVESGLVFQGRLCRKQSVILRKAEE